MARVRSFNEEKTILSSGLFCILYIIDKFTIKNKKKETKILFRSYLHFFFFSYSKIKKKVCLYSFSFLTFLSSSSQDMLLTLIIKDK